MKKEKLDFKGCIKLLSELVDTGMLQKDPKNKDNILIYRKAGDENSPEGWYSENILSVASGLTEDEESQRFLMGELETEKALIEKHGFIYRKASEKAHGFIRGMNRFFCTIFLILYNKILDFCP